ncbi:MULTISPECIES: hypothetical protein [Helicobacter]|uniref:Uncharacterized protein n=1 Tax=Helicobacter felis (strain ATCC 49179 / CCUG 28539 / NCTC 12436 / CS1) TaxID=936155 RepID=E7AC18_HELFC|nr:MULTISPECIES: hypothetical protein [Helicobacter]CBY82100.1 hypothetical protein HFELIS_00160 [Helicobacter felis ATCC 49179]
MPSQKPSSQEYAKKLQKVRAECKERLKNPEILAVYQRLAQK